MSFLPGDRPNRALVQKMLRRPERPLNNTQADNKADYDIVCQLVGRLIESGESYMLALSRCLGLCRPGSNNPPPRRLDDSNYKDEVHQYVINVLEENYKASLYCLCFSLPSLCPARSLTFVRFRPAQCRTTDQLVAAASVGAHSGNFPLCSVVSFSRTNTLSHFDACAFSYFRTVRLFLHTLPSKCSLVFSL